MDLPREVRILALALASLVRGDWAWLGSPQASRQEVSSSLAPRVVLGSRAGPALRASELHLGRAWQKPRDTALSPHKELRQFSPDPGRGAH